jgi:peptide/nickel transport system permease protein
MGWKEEMNTGPWIRRVAGALTLMLVIASVLGDFLSPVEPGAQDLSAFYVPPTGIHLFDPESGFRWRPFVYGYRLVDPLNVTYELEKEIKNPLRFFEPGYAYLILGFIPSSAHLITGKGYHPLGTDELGRDVLSRVLSGSRTSLLIVSVGISIYVTLGLAIGALAGTAGGWVDFALMRLAEFVLALPVLYLILALRATLPLRMPFWQTLLLTAGTIAGVTWPPMARGVRGLIRQIRNAGYVEAANSLGCSRWRVFSRHMLPSLPAFVLAQAVVAAPAFLLGEVVLSFLDVGFRDSGDSWGSMLRGLKNDTRVLTDFWWNLLPLLLIFITLFCLNALGRRTTDGGRGATI